MRRVMTVALGVAIVAVLGGAAYAAGPHGPGMGMGMWGGASAGEPGPQWMPGRTGMMPGRMAMMRGGMGGGAWNCPGPATGSAAVPDPVTEEKAKELATAYVDKYLKGYTIERVLPFDGRMGTAYQVELKGPKGEARVLHVNPWGQVRPFARVAAVD